MSQRRAIRPRRARVCESERCGGFGVVLSSEGLEKELERGEGGFEEEELGGEDVEVLLRNRGERGTSQWEGKGVKREGQKGEV